jgi:hypothetical protein
MSRLERLKSSKDQKLIKASLLKCMIQKKEFLPKTLEKLTKEERTSELKTLKLLILLINNDSLYKKHDLFIEIYLTFYIFTYYFNTTFIEY